MVIRKKKEKKLKEWAEFAPPGIQGKGGCFMKASISDVTNSVWKDQFRGGFM